jgi:hypothetical protein
MNILQAMNIGGLEVTVTDGMQEDTLELLRHTVVGSPGGLRYALRNVEEQARSYEGKIFFLTVRRKGNIFGTVAFCQRTAFTLGKPHSSFYVRYLSIDRRFQRKITRLEKESKRKSRKVLEGTMTETLFKILNHPELMKIFTPKEGGQALLYNMLEGYNQRSENLIRKAGYEHVRNMATFPFSRIKPRKHRGFDRLRPEEKESLEKALFEFYHDYSLFTLDYAKGRDAYFVIHEEGKIVAALQAQPFTLHFEELPELWGWFLFKVIGRLPVMRKIFTPGQFNSVGMDAFYYLPGKETALIDLMESVLAEYKRNTALMWIDVDGPLYRDLKRTGQLGALSRLFRGRPVKLYARLEGMPEKTRKQFCQTPAYMSSFDLT